MRYHRARARPIKQKESKDLPGPFGAPAWRRRTGRLFAIYMLRKMSRAHPLAERERMVRRDTHEQFL
jgi:hypothetical protein